MQRRSFCLCGQLPSGVSTRSILPVGPMQCAQKVYFAVARKNGVAGMCDPKMVATLMGRANCAELSRSGDVFTKRGCLK